MVSHLYFFAPLNKEQKRSYLQLRRKLNGKMLVLGFVYSKSASKLKQKKRRKNQHVKRLRFSLNTNQRVHVTKKMYTQNRLFKAMIPRFCFLTDTKQSL